MARIISFLKFLAWALLALLLVWFAANNTNGVELTFEPFSGALIVAPWLILFAGIFIGLVAAAFATSWRRLNAFVSNRQLKRERDQLGSEVATLSEEAHTRAAQDARAKLTNASVTGMTPAARDQI